MRKLALIVAASLALSGCAVGSALTGLPTSPAAAADRTKLDEQAGLTLTLAYTAASRAAGFAITTAKAIGHPLSAATVKRIGELDAAAFAAVTAARNAYLAANSAGYLAAIQQARAAVADLLAAFGTPTAQLTPVSHSYADGYAAAKVAHDGLAAAGRV